MKNLTLMTLIFTFSLIHINVFAQFTKNTKPPLTLYKTESGSFILDTVINVNDVSKSHLYKRAKNWVISTVRTSDQTVIFDDENNDEIRTDVTINIDNGVFATPPKVNFKLAIYLKDNKYRIIANSFKYYAFSTSTGIYEAEFHKIKVMGKKSTYKMFDDEFTKFLNSLNESLNKSIDNDW